jgi:hypothetical protein
MIPMSDKVYLSVLYCTTTVFLRHPNDLGRSSTPDTIRGHGYLGRKHNNWGNGMPPDQEQSVCQPDSSSAVSLSIEHCRMARAVRFDHKVGNRDQVFDRRRSRRGSAGTFQIFRGVSSVIDSSGAMIARFCRHKPALPSGNVQFLL